MDGFRRYVTQENPQAMGDARAALRGRLHGVEGLSEALVATQGAFEDSALPFLSLVFV